MEPTGTGFKLFYAPNLNGIVKFCINSVDIVPTSMNGKYILCIWAKDEQSARNALRDACISQSFAHHQNQLYTCSMCLIPSKFDNIILERVVLNPLINRNICQKLLQPLDQTDLNHVHNIDPINFPETCFINVNTQRDTMICITIYYDMIRMLLTPNYVSNPFGCQKEKILQEFNKANRFLESDDVNVLAFNKLIMHKMTLAESQQSRSTCMIL
ncbi:MAG: hypothetical protein Satyrvirus27_14 [Satyrvirus sp.]|uniref:Uncharacterized protein n=1 Tax=Satyrvirus sp. TaxID=2487771 RepID=A0A3G5AEN5_9VIRU|nr:MAG: hypothetical protein Satyrvirus27_14 [Satyrvirus sp.]